MSVNKVILVGNLGKDPELRYTASGVAVATFSMATSERFKNREGEQQEKTEWHNIVAWRQLAEICGKYLQKGKQVYIEGKIQTRSYDDRDGNKRYMTEIVADQMQMLGQRGESGGSNSGGGYQPQQQRPADNFNQSRDNNQAASSPENSFNEPPFNPDDDIPF
ncbi:MAG: single-stranded DNA-binding protein [Desulfuromonadales bacterium]|nr:single-stranded DNA-binding protein [Desulfuromonadales bacterium]MDT8423223.1 single-stranded DNA-binding protein [Desulfuromonadales bacterium]